MKGENDLSGALESHDPELFNDRGIASAAASGKSSSPVGGTASEPLIVQAALINYRSRAEYSPSRVCPTDLQVS